MTNDKLFIIIKSIIITNLFKDYYIKKCKIFSLFGDDWAYQNAMMSMHH